MNPKIAIRKCETILHIIAKKESTPHLDALYDKVESVMNYVKRYNQITGKQWHALEVWQDFAEKG